MIAARSVAALLLVATSACAGRTPVSVQPAHHAYAPLLLRGDEIAAARQRLASGDPAYRAAYAALIHDADSALRLPPFTVTAKKRTPPSSDKHDYMSLAPYWWPDTTKPNGVPFIRRDGEVNPESRLDTDSPRFLRFADAVESLTLAYTFSRDAKYANRAATLLRAWFLDPATRMNPNLRFAQAIPGVTEGRGIGIIDTRNLATIVDDVLLLRDAPGWSRDDDAAIRAWCRTFLDWLIASPQGKEEAIQANNHGTWYDAQVASLALFVGDTALARRTIVEAGPKRIAAQIAPDGSQPEELARTRPIHYSLFNIEPFARLAELGRHVDVDLWHYRAPNGAGIHEAVLFVAPYLDSARKWKGAEVVPAHPEEFIRTIRQAARAYHDPRIDRALRSMPADVLRDDRSRLLYTDPSLEARLDSLIPSVVSFASARMRRAVDALDPRDGYPRATNADGRWNLLPATSWTSGFFAGSLWQMFDLTGDSLWAKAAKRWTEGLASNASRTDTHDLGFLVFNSFGKAIQHGDESRAREVVLTASRSLVSRFNPAVGAIKSWDTEQATDGRAKWAFPVIIDNMMNLEMLFWAAAHGGDPSWRVVAERHALTSARAHVRDDGSTFHVASFDPKSGALVARATWQGYSDSSVWARGQAWAIYGFTRAYEETKNPQLLAIAQRVADWYAAHLPDDAVPFWDFRDPAIPNCERDASTAAIAASGLLRLAEDVPPELASRYREVAERALVALATSYLDPRPAGMAVLQHAVGGKPQATEVDVGLVYADYYFLEAVGRYSRQRGPKVP